MARSREDRRVEIADRTIEVLAGMGSRGLTHRAVDTAAGLPAGSTSYYFRTREALLIAAAQRLAELDLSAAPEASEVPTTVDDLVRLLSRLVLAQSTTLRTRTLARYHLSMEATRYPEVQASLDELGSRFTRAATALLTQIGTRHPARDARAVIAVCAGLVYESTVGGQRPFTLPEIRSVLSDVLRARTRTTTAD